MEEEKKCEECGENCSGDCDHCARKSQTDFRVELNDRSKIRLMIGVLSGKGGVGKSLVTSLLAKELSAKGMKVGILDGDITGPSIPKSFGIHEPAYQEENLLIPAVTSTGIKIISSNMFLENEDDPIIWRGSLISNLLTQFYKDVKWGTLDVLFIDLPPGTGDVSLTSFQSFPIDGVLIVTSPQELVSLIVRKSIRMVEMMNLPILGIVENMSYVVCPNCSEKIYIYGSQDAKSFQSRYGYERLAQIPFDRSIASKIDEGNIESLGQTYFDDVVAMIQNMEELKHE